MIFVSGYMSFKFLTKLCCMGKQVVSPSDEGKPGVRMMSVSLLIQRYDFVAMSEGFFIVCDHDHCLALGSDFFEMINH